MAISPPGDIVLDVAKAADPASVETARARLASMANRASSLAEGSGFADTVRGGVRTSSSASPNGSKEVFVKFEAMVLQSFIQSMMPQNTESVYGEGLAGEMWQSLMAEKIAESVAKRGGIGIADRILRDHYMAGEEKVPLQGVSNDPDKPARDTEQMLSLALIQEIQRKVTQSLNEDGAFTTETGSR